MVEATQVVVTVTGITGFVGSTVAIELLKQRPDWKVRGTVRSLTNGAKINPLRKALGEDFEKVELVEANLTDLESMKRAIAGSTYVIHVASPVPLKEPKDPMDLIRPAVEGTTNVLTACKESGVRRVSITSSGAAITGASPDDAEKIFTERDWPNPEQQHGFYEKSKTMAERAAWDFVNAMPEAERIELTTVCPGMILGPTTVNEGFFSGDVMKLFMNGAIPGGIPRIQFGVVDVREIATAHIRCIERDEAQGKRFMLTGESLWLIKIGEIISERYSPMGFPVQTKESNYWLVKFFALFKKEAATIVKYWGRNIKLDNSRSKEVLGIEYRPVKDSLYDMIDSLIKAGHFNSRPKL